MLINYEQIINSWQLEVNYFPALSGLYCGIQDFQRAKVGHLLLRKSRLRQGFPSSACTSQLGAILRPYHSHILIQVSSC